MQTRNKYERFTLPGLTRESKQEDVLDGIKAWLLQGKEHDCNITFVQEQTFTLLSNFPSTTWHWYICVGWFKNGQQEDEVGHQVFWYKGQGIHAHQSISYETLGEIVELVRQI